MTVEYVRALHGGEWSVREVLDIARVARVPVRTQTAYRILYSLDLEGRRAPGKRRHFRSREAFNPPENPCGKPCEQPVAGSVSGIISDASKPHFSDAPKLDQKANSLDTSLTLRASLDHKRNDPGIALLPLTSFGDAAGGNASRPSRETIPGKPRKKRAEVDTSWIGPLEEQARSLFPRRLESFTKDERHIAGRYHALRFSNCKREASRNKEIGRRIAAGLSTLGSHQLFSDMTFGEYVAYAEDVHKQCDEKPWYDPWLIKAVVEFE